MKQIELVNVTDQNNNKYYKMKQLNSSEWEAEWGRVGCEKPQKQIYQIYDWDKKYNEKLKKGYKDITSLRAEVKDNGSTISIHPLLKTLQKYAKDKIAESYTISAEAVTKAQVEEAQRLVDELLNYKKFSIDQLNLILRELYSSIPRKMKDTRDHFLTIQDNKKIKEIIKNEQELLDVMEQQVSINKTVNFKNHRSLEEQLGLKIEDCTKEDIEIIKKMMGSNSNQFKKAFRVTNIKTEKEFKDQLKKSHKHWTKLLWHGSRNENWLNIIKTGLLIRPSGVVLTGSMFGNGIYFADKAQKSIGYTSLSGSYWARGNDKQAFLAIYEVNSGMEYRTKTREDWMCNCTYKKLQDKGQYDSLFCEGGADLRNNELMIYQQEQCTIKYIVEISN